MPERDVFESRLSIGADYAGEAGNLLACDGIAFVGHGGAALLARGEWLLGLANLGALQVADLECNFVKARGDAGEYGNVVGVKIARQDLGSDGSGFQTKAGADPLFGFGPNVRERADGARDFAHADLFGGGEEAGMMAAELVVPQGELQAKGDGFGMDAMGAADLDCEFVAERGFLEMVEQGIEAKHNESRSGLELEGLG